MSSIEIGKKLIELCNQGNSKEALNSLYSDNAISIEAREDNGDMPSQIQGLESIRQKHEWWEQNFEVHSAEAQGPFPKGEQFAAIFKMDVTHKQSGERSQMQEIALYTVDKDKIVKEEFFY